MKRIPFLVLIGIASILFQHSTADELARTNLLQYATSGGEVRAVKTKSDWKVRATQIRSAMVEVMGPFPAVKRSTPLNPKWIEDVDCGEYIRKKLTYQSEPGGEVPAYLFVPKLASGKSRRFPAALCLHQTSSSGYRVVAGLAGGDTDAYAMELAKRGFVCLMPAYPGLSDYNPDLQALGYSSGTMKAIWDNVRGIDLLQSLPFVKPGPVAAVGHSLGGHNSLFTAAFDDRIRVVVTSCGFDSFADYMDGNITGWTSGRYMPRLKSYPAGKHPFDFPEVLAAIAPRAIFINAPLHDSNFKASSVDRVISIVRPVYELHRAAGNLRVEHPDAEHSFPPTIRAQALDFIEGQLKR